MREILFRGKRKDNGKFVYGFLVMNKCSTKENGRLVYCTRPEIIPIGEIGEADYDGDGNYYEYVVIPETVGQYTGLTDKNGKKIFEGDILKQYGFCYVVSFENGSYVAYETPYNESAILPRTDWGNAVVVGNIHDNPELLKGGEG